MLRLRSKHTRGIAAALTVVLAASVAGCSINPTPRGFAPNPEGEMSFTEDMSAYIAEKARCELRDAFVILVSRLLEKRFSKIPPKELAQSPGLIKELQPWDVDPVAQVRSSIFTNSTFKLDFNVKTTEKNNNAFSLGLLPKLGNPQLTLAVPDHSANLTRDNERKFGLESIEIEELQTIDCHNDPKTSRTVNILYPTTGNIGLSKTVAFFASFLQIGTTKEEREVWAERSLAEAYVSLIGVEADRETIATHMERIIERIRRFSSIFIK